MWWLVASLVWGVLNLASSMKLEHSYVSTECQGNKQLWTFGQIAPLILLLAPVLSVMEFLCGRSYFVCLKSLLSNATKEPASSIGDSAVRTVVTSTPRVPSRTETVQLATRTTVNPLTGLCDDPDHDFYREAWFRSLLFCLVSTAVLQTALFLLTSAFFLLSTIKNRYTSVAFLSALIPSAYVLSWPPMAMILCTVFFILNSMVLKSLEMDYLLVRIILGLSTGTVFLISPLFTYALRIFNIAWISFSIILYIILSVIIVMRIKTTR